MDTPTQATLHDMGTLAEDVRALIAATADMAGDKVNEARQRLAAALNGGNTILERVKAKAVEGAKATNDALHEHPYQAVGVALGMAAILGYLVARQCCRHGD